MKEPWLHRKAVQFFPTALRLNNKAARDKTSRVCYSGGIGTQHSNAAVCAETDEHAVQMLCAGKENRAGTWGTQEINL